MGIRRFAWLTAAIVWAATAQVQAQAIPALLPVQGFLADGSGNSVDGAVDLTFRIYASEMDESPLYEEMQSVMVDQGRFTSYVGDVTDLDLAIMREHASLWMGIAIGDDEELPRFALASVPYAAMAQYCADASSLDGVAAEDYALAADLASAVDPKRVQTRVDGTCSAGKFVTEVKQDGTVVCAAPTGAGASYTAGTGLTLTDTEFALDPGAVQAPTASACSAGQYVASIAADGSTTCAADAHASGSCNAGQFVKEIDAGGNLMCVDETSYGAGSGLDLDPGSHTFSIPAGGIDSSMVADNTLTSADLASDAAGPAQMAPASGGEAFAINFGGLWDSIDTFSATPYMTPSGTSVCMMAVNVRIENDSLDGGLVGAVPIYRVSGGVAVDTAGGLAWTDVATSLTNNNTVVTSVGVATLMPNTSYDFGCRIRIPSDVADNSARCHLQYACF